jgi:hypothetical protein
MTPQVWKARMDDMLKNYDPFSNLQHFETIVTEPDVINTWDEFLEWTRMFGGRALFRGQARSCWHLTTTLDREVEKRIEIHADDIITESIHPIKQAGQRTADS